MAMRIFLHSKIHRAVVTEADVDYVGSISIDEDLMDAAGLAEYEQVHVVGLSGGGRVITYVVKAPRGSGIIGINGAAALLIKEGELVIIFGYVMVDESEMASLKPRIVLMGQDNKIDRVVDGEIHGTTA
jgi:aspartate 1-decarboxylase